MPVMAAATSALIRRDTMQLEVLMQISAGWLQHPDETEAQQKMLHAMLEAACLLEGEPSELADTSWFLAFAGFAVLVILHELGHFAVAKWVGMRVEKFSLFFPPTLVSKKIGETEYAIGAIPAGGYVRVTGMNPDEDLPDEVRDRAYHAQPVWKRICVIAAGPAVNLIVAFLLLFVFFAAIGPQPVTERVGTIAH